jgi:predicted dehydrogenase
MCRTLAEADEMVAACERAHVKLAIAHQTRYSPRMARVKEFIAEGKLGNLLELRGRGKEDARGGGEDLMVLGTHVMDLMRFLAGNPTWCFARVLDGGKLTAKAQVRDGNEGIGPLAGDEINAVYGFASPTLGTFSTHRAQHGAGARFGLQALGTKGMLTMTTGSLPPVFFCEDPSWSPGRSKAPWVEITSAGLGKPETMQDAGLHLGNVLIAKDLIRAIEIDAQPLGSMYDGRAALEMILAVYESHRLNAPVELPLKNREHPLMSL